MNLNYFKKKIKEIINAMGLDISYRNARSNNEIQIKKALDYFKINKVIDVGANEGQFTLSLLQSGYKGKIISLEPLEQAHSKLKYNSLCHKNWSVTQYPIAVGEEVKTVEINISENSVSSSLLNILPNHVKSAPSSRKIGTQTVKMTTLDKIFDEYVEKSDVVLLKIDTQGYERQVLSGGLIALSQVQIVLIEVSLVELYKGQILWEEIISFFKKIDFDLWIIQKGFTDNKTGQSLQVDLGFVKKST